MNSTSSEEFNDWRAEALGIDLQAFIMGEGHKLVRQGREWVGPCPNCGGHDRFSISPTDRVYNCRGAGGGGYIDAVMHAFDCNFLEACEMMTGRPAPQSERKQGTRKTAPASPPPAPPPCDEPPVDEAPPPQRGGGRRTFRDDFRDGGPVPGSLAEEYLRWRCLDEPFDWTADMRFAAALPYYGLATADADEATFIGNYPALIAAIRDVDGRMIGIHRTYLSACGMGKAPVRDLNRRNNAKKMSGEMKGGAIRLSAAARTLVIGEGIETTRSAFHLGIGGPDAGYWVAGSLGNMAGACTGSIPHPSIEKRSIVNGEPDPERPGMILPDTVEHVILLGDGDSDKATTSALLLTAGRRWKAQGRDVSYAIAPEGLDWNDVLRKAVGA